jgi:hypothetical protein
MDQGDKIWQQLVDTKFYDGMGLTAADFHDLPGPGREFVYGFGISTRGLSIPIFINVFHGTISLSVGSDGTQSDEKTQS